jgi:multidrug efflux pump subunit AcrB
MMFTPIAISLAFGVLTSSLIALLVVPCFCLILEDITGWLREGKTPSEQNL